MASPPPPTSAAHQALARAVLAISPVGPAPLLDLLEAFSPLALERGQAFATAGELELRVGFVAAGTLRAFFLTEAGEEYTKDFFRPGDFAAAPSSLFLHRPSNVMVTACEPAQLLVARGEVLERLYDGHLELGRFARKVVERVYAAREEKEYELAVLTAAERYRRFQERFPGLEAALPAWQVASYLGITPTQLGRVRAAVVGR